MTRSGEKLQSDQGTKSLQGLCLAQDKQPAVNSHFQEYQNLVKGAAKFCTSVPNLVVLDFHNEIIVIFFLGCSSVSVSLNFIL